MALTKISRSLLDTGVSDSSDATAITIDSNEKVGIGTTSPATTLDVTSSSDEAVYLRSTHATTTNVFITNTNATTGNTASVVFAPANNITGATIKCEAIEDFSTSANRTADLLFLTRKDGTLSEKMRIDSSGNVGIGLTNPSDYYSTQLVLSAPDNGGITLASTTTSASNYIMFADGTSGTDRYKGYVSYGHNDNQLNLVSSGYTRFFTDSSQTERMRINSAGALLVGTTTHTNNSSGSETVAEFVYDHYQRGVEIRSTVGGNNQSFLGFRYGGGPTDCGGIRRDGNNQTPEFFSGSDKRIKTNIQDMDSTLSKICQMPLVKYDLKDGSGSGVGVLAQDLINIFPEKVTTTDDGKGETLPDGVEAWTVGHNYTYQILKAIQELTLKVEELEGKIE